MPCHFTFEAIYWLFAELNKRRPSSRRRLRRGGQTAAPSRRLSSRRCSPVQPPSSLIRPRLNTRDPPHAACPSPAEADRGTHACLVARITSTVGRPSEQEGRTRVRADRPLRPPQPSRGSRATAVESGLPELPRFLGPPRLSCRPQTPVREGRTSCGVSAQARSALINYLPTDSSTENWRGGRDAYPRRLNKSLNKSPCWCRDVTRAVGTP